jgi:hypothetical protein
MFKADPLALDPLGPMGLDLVAAAHSPSDPLALDPLSPVATGESGSAPRSTSDHSSPNTYAKGTPCNPPTT